MTAIKVIPRLHVIYEWIRVNCIHYQAEPHSVVLNDDHEIFLFRMRWENGSDYIEIRPNEHSLADMESEICDSWYDGECDGLCRYHDHIFRYQLVEEYEYIGRVYALIPANWYIRSLYQILEKYTWLHDAERHTPSITGKIARKLLFFV